MTRSEIFTKAHKIAKQIADAFGSYREAFSKALKGVYNQITCPVKKGEKVIINGIFAIIVNTNGLWVNYRERTLSGRQKLDGFAGRISHSQLKMWLKNGMAKKG